MSERGYYDITDIPFTWDRVIPGFLNANTQQQRALMQQYIQKNFTYSFTPFKDGEHIKLAPVEYTQQVLDNERANCNVAATEMAIGTMAFGHVGSLEPVDEDPEPLHGSVNVVMGYNNSDTDGMSALTDYELHAGDVTGTGEFIDATPYRPESTEQVSKAEVGVSADTVLGLGAAIALGSFGLWRGGRRLRTAVRRRGEQKRSAAETAKQAHIELIQQEVQADSERLERTVRVLDAVRYDPNADVAAALHNRDIFAATKAPDVALESLLRIARDESAQLHEQNQRPQTLIQRIRSMARRPQPSFVSAVSAALQNARQSTTETVVLQALDETEMLLGQARLLHEYAAEQR
jgi:hypothetical protein